MAIELISKIKPKNNGNFKLVDAIDVETTEGTSVEEALETLKDLIDEKGAGTGDMLESVYSTTTKTGYVDKAVYADTAGSATNANSLGNVASSSYATKTYVTTTLSDYAKKTDLQDLGGGDMLASIYAKNNKTGYVDNAIWADNCSDAVNAEDAENAANAAKLGGNLPSYYATAASVTDLIQIISCLCTPISFTIDGARYNVPQGFTWNEWVNTDNNQDGYEVYDDGKLYTEDQHAVMNPSTNKQCLGTDAIQNGKNYKSQ